MKTYDPKPSSKVEAATAATVSAGAEGIRAGSGVGIDCEPVDEVAPSLEAAQPPKPMARVSAKATAAILDILARVSCLKGCEPLDTRKTSANFLEFASNKLGNFIGVQSCALTKVVSNDEKLDAVWEVE